MAKVLGCGLEVSEFEFQSCYYVHFRAEGLGKYDNRSCLKRDIINIMECAKKAARWLWIKSVSPWIVAARMQAGKSIERPEIPDEPRNIPNAVSQYANKIYL